MSKHVCDKNQNKSGSTNKKDWDSFVRSKGRFKVHEYYEGNKVECFNMWLDCDKNWDRVQLEVERQHEQRVEAERGWVATQGKDIRKTHTEEKAEQLFKSRKAAGLWYPSEDFEGDNDEPQHLFD